MQRCNALGHVELRPSGYTTHVVHRVRIMPALKTVLDVHLRPGRPQVTRAPRGPANVTTRGGSVGPREWLAVGVLACLGWLSWPSSTPDQATTTTQASESGASGRAFLGVPVAGSTPSDTALLASPALEQPDLQATEVATPVQAAIGLLNAGKRLEAQKQLESLLQDHRVATNEVYASSQLLAVLATDLHYLQWVAGARQAALQQRGTHADTVRAQMQTVADFGFALIQNGKLSLAHQWLEASAPAYGQHEEVGMMLADVSLAKDEFSAALKALERVDHPSDRVNARMDELRFLIATQQQ